MMSGLFASRPDTTIAFVSTKGGVGKTTLAGHVAVEADRCGKGPVGLVDMDPQGSLAEWWNVRKVPTPVFVQASVDRAHDEFAKLKCLGVRLTVIDTPPAIHELIEAAADHADLVVVPLRPSPHDIRSIRTTLDVVEPFAKPVVFVLNGATVGARITREAVSLLSRYGPLAPTIVHQRVDYAASMIDGRTVMEVRQASRAREEIHTLWSHLEGWCYRPEHQGIPQASTFGSALSAGA